MKKILLPLMAASMGLAQFQNIDVTPENLKNYEQIVDIRTEPEWIQTGIVEGAKTITFNPYDVNEFIRELKEQVDITKPIALICRSGNRSFTAAKIMDSSGLKIVNLNGGMGSLIYQGYKTVPFKK